MELAITSTGSSKAGKVEVQDAVFGREFNPTLVHQVVTSYLAGGRQGSKAQKTRAEVRGGGAKPWRQKGMGRARAGTNTSPIWVGGGRTFAAKPRDFSQKVNKKMHRAALSCMLSKLIADENLIVVESFSLEQPKTKEMVNKLGELKVDNVLIVVSDIEENVYLASRNVPNVNLMDVVTLDPVSLFKRKKVIMTVSALKALEERLA